MKDEVLVLQKIDLHIFNAGADDIAKLFSNELKIFDPQFSTHMGGWEIITLTNNIAQADDVIKKIKQFFPDIIVGDIMTGFVDMFQHKNQTLTVAESCTGGKVASLITSVSGSSQVFNGSMVVYSDEIKQAWIKVSKASLKAFGAVSSAVAQEMAMGVLKAANAHHAIAISGIAGPTGGSKEKPVEQFILPMQIAMEKYTTRDFCYKEAGKKFKQVQLIMR